MQFPKPESLPEHHVCEGMKRLQSLNDQLAQLADSERSRAESYKRLYELVLAGEKIQPKAEAA